jgi:hypothetical protein
MLRNIINYLVDILYLKFHSNRSINIFFVAHHFAQIQEFDKAERCYLKAQCPGECVEMYNRAAKWEQAFRKTLINSNISF